MIEREEIIAAVNEELQDGNPFLVDVKVSAGNDVEIFIDSDERMEDGRLRGVNVDDCVRLTKAIECRFDRDTEDFSLTVSSAGIGQPLRVMRQYRKLIGQNVEVILGSGVKLVGVLDAVETGTDGTPEGGSIALSYLEKRKAEGQKRPETVTATKTFPFAEVKTTKEYIDFK